MKALKALNLVGVLFITFSGFSVVSVGQWFRRMPLAALGFASLFQRKIKSV